MKISVIFKDGDVLTYTDVIEFNIENPKNSDWGWISMTLSNGNKLTLHIDSTVTINMRILNKE